MSNPKEELVRNVAAAIAQGRDALETLERDLGPAAAELIRRKAKELATARVHSFIDDLLEKYK